MLDGIYHRGQNVGRVSTPTGLWSECRLLTVLDLWLAWVRSGLTKLPRAFVPWTSLTATGDPPEDSPGDAGYADFGKR